MPVLALFFSGNAAEERVDFSGSSPTASSSATSAGTFAKFRRCSHRAVTRVFDAGNAIETHEHGGDFKETLDYPFTSIRV